MPRPYGSIQFLKDAAWFGLSARDAFSREKLRRQRDRLMSIHHPDRGGNVEIASRINSTYDSMVEWLTLWECRTAEVKPARPPKFWPAATLMAMLWAAYRHRRR